MLVGEMLSDDDDREGKPSVGAAGWLLDTALHEAGIERNDIYLTYVVKHFRWEAQGRRRLHKKPSARHIAACRRWLEAELHVIEPSVVVCLGAIAAQFFLGRNFRATHERGKFFGFDPGCWIIATHHSQIASESTICSSGCNRLNKIPGQTFSRRDSRSPRIS